MNLLRLFFILLFLDIGAFWLASKAAMPDPQGNENKAAGNAMLALGALGLVLFGCCIGAGLAWWVR